MKKHFDRAIISIIGQIPITDNGLKYDAAYLNLKKWMAGKDWSYRNLTIYAKSLGAAGEVGRGFILLSTMNNPNQFPAQVKSVWHYNVFEGVAAMPPVMQKVSISVPDDEIAFQYLTFLSYIKLIAV